LEMEMQKNVANYEWMILMLFRIPLGTHCEFNGSPFRTWWEQMEHIRNDASPSLATWISWVHVAFCHLLSKISRFTFVYHHCWFRLMTMTYLVPSIFQSWVNPLFLKKYYYYYLKKHIGWSLTNFLKAMGIP